MLRFRRSRPPAACPPAAGAARADRSPAAATAVTRVPVRAACGAALVALAFTVAGPLAAPALAAPAVPQAAAAAPAPALAAAAPAAALRSPAVLQLPFPCGETWRGNGTASSKHKGGEIDFNWGSGSQDLGRKVVAAAAGTVQFAGNKGSGYGNYVQIRHADETYTLYAHMGKRLSVRTGAKVAQGAQVGTVAGSSGFSRSIDVHLHFEHKTSPRQAGFIRIRFDGKPYPYGLDAAFIKSNNCQRKSDGPAPRPGHVALDALDGRTVRDASNHAYPDLYGKGDAVGVVCKSTGTTGYADPTWALTDKHVWVVGQGLSQSNGKRGIAANVPTCTVPLKARALDDLNSRASKNMDDVDRADRYRKGDPVPVVCTALGGATGPGLHTWARTAHDVWVPARYLHLALGQDGLSSRVPRCDKDKAGDTGGGTGGGARRDSSTLSVSEKGTVFIAGEEGFNGGKHYEDGDGYCTVGYGHLLRYSGCTAAEMAAPPMTVDKGMQLLRADLRQRLPGVRDMTAGLRLTQNEFDALASIAFNIGPAKLQRIDGKPTEFITVLRQVPASRAQMPERFEAYSSRGKPYYCGQNKRRQREARIFLLADYDPRKITNCRDLA